MYKIKDDIDLKELEEFGYIKGTLYDTECWILNELTYKVFININKRKIMVQYTEFGAHPSDDRTNYTTEDIDIYIADLIQANLVEKVEENDK